MAVRLNITTDEEVNERLQARAAGRRDKPVHQPGDSRLAALVPQKVRPDSKYRCCRLPALKRPYTKRTRENIRESLDELGFAGARNQRYLQLFATAAWYATVALRP
jgi:hypothetical protein